MHEHEDAFARMLLDHREGRRSHEVIERSDGCTRHGSTAVAGFDYLLASPDEMRELAASRGWEGRRVIEVATDDYYLGVLRKG